MCTYLTYDGREYLVRSVPAEVAAGTNGQQLTYETLSCIVADALLPFPEAAAAVVALMDERLGPDILI